jgi:predicted HD superfamily hydrolase involved in NAD metabolism
LKHSKETALLAQSLCKRFNADPDEGYTAGLLHDIARELDQKTMESLAHEDGRPFEEWDSVHPILLHGRAGAILCKKKFKITAKDIIEAIRDHTYGRPAMGLLSRIVYVSDFLEPSRDFNESKEREEILKKDIDSIMMYVTKRKIGMAVVKSRPVIVPALEMYNELKEKVKNLVAKTKA